MVGVGGFFIIDRQLRCTETPRHSVPSYCRFPRLCRLKCVKSRRGLNSASIDLIYLDPPFNSTRNYAAPVGSAAAGAAFKDTWTLSDLDVAWMGLLEQYGPWRNVVYLY